MSRDRISQAGFSLLEVLVGVSILAVLTATVSLSLDRTTTPLSAEGERLAIRLTHAQQEAVITGRPTGIVVNENAYGFVTFLDGQWWPIRDHPSLDFHDLPAGFRISAQSHRAGTAEDGVVWPTIWFDPAGMDAPWRLRLDRQGQSVTIETGERGTVHLGEETG